MKRRPSSLVPAVYSLTCVSSRATAAQTPDLPPHQCSQCSQCGNNSFCAAPHLRLVQARRLFPFPVCVCAAE